MISIDRYRESDREAVHAMFRTLHGDADAEAYLTRWNWQYERNPNSPNGVPLIWLVRLDGNVIGQYATMPVRLMANGEEIDAAWGTDVMMMPGHQRLGMGRLMFDAWDKGVGASIGLGLTDASHRLFQKLQWPDMGRVPRFLKRLSARKQDALDSAGPFGLRIRRGVKNAVIRRAPVGRDIQVVQAFDDNATRLWERVREQFAFAVRRDAAYLNWKFAHAAHLNYVMAIRTHGEEMLGYAIIHHVNQGGWRVTVLSDFLAGAGDDVTLRALLHWVDREALAARSDVIRVSSTNRAFNLQLRRSGYEELSPTIRFVAKINAVAVPADFYQSFDKWHVTVGDSDSDR